MDNKLNYKMRSKLKNILIYLDANSVNTFKSTIDIIQLIFCFISANETFKILKDKTRKNK